MRDDIPEISESDFSRAIPGAATVQRASSRDSLSEADAEQVRPSEDSRSANGLGPYDWMPDLDREVPPRAAAR